MNSQITLSVVLPAFREAAHIGGSLEVIRQVLRRLDVSFELICVDDGSPDHTWDEIERAAERMPELRALKLSRNFGKEGAMLAGLEASRGDAVVVMDCDLQHPPEVIPTMFELWRTGRYKVVNGVKQRTNRRSRLGDLGARLFYGAFQRLTNMNMADSSDFKLLDREVVDAYLVLGERRLFFRAMISWMGFSRIDVPFDVAERTAGISSFSPLRLLKMAAEALVSFSPALMQLVTPMGVLFLLFALVVGGHTLYRKFTGQAVEGFTTVILIELTIGSCVLLGLGVIGAYIARIHEEVKARPRYLVDVDLDRARQSPRLRIFDESPSHRRAA